jgi:hypothetical protein
MEATNAVSFEAAVSKITLRGIINPLRFRWERILFARPLCGMLNGSTLPTYTWLGSSAEREQKNLLKMESPHHDHALVSAWHKPFTNIGIQALLQERHEKCSTGGGVCLQTSVSLFSLPARRRFCHVQKCILLHISYSFVS